MKSMMWVRLMSVMAVCASCGDNGGDAAWTPDCDTGWSQATVQWAGLLDSPDGCGPLASVLSPSGEMTTQVYGTTMTVGDTVFDWSQFTAVDPMVASVTGDSTQCSVTSQGLFLRPDGTYSYNIRAVMTFWDDNPDHDECRVTYGLQQVGGDPTTLWYTCTVTSVPCTYSGPGWRS